MAKQTVIRQSLKDQIKTILIDRIVEGDLAPGDRIKELQVAKEFGTSQAPVREAIRCLETLGYVEHLPHVGAMVKSFHKDEIEEAYQVREALEVHSVSLIKKNEAKLADRLETCLGQMRQATKEKNIRAFTEADNCFHREIINASSNKTMLATWEALKMQLQVIAVLVEASVSLDDIYALHPPIVAAFAAADGEKAASLLQGHYKIVGNFWKQSK